MKPITYSPGVEPLDDILVKPTRVLPLWQFMSKHNRAITVTDANGQTWFKVTQLDLAWYVNEGFDITLVTTQ